MAEYTGAFLEPAAERISDKLIAELNLPVDIRAITPKVAAISPLTQAAMQRTASQAGLGTLGFDPTTGEVTSVGAGTGISAYEPYVQRAEQAYQAATGMVSPTAYQQYMSPYQQEVLDATEKLLAEQRASGRAQLGSEAIGAGAYGGARAGVQQAEYERQRDLFDAAQLAQLRQAGYEQAVKQAQAAGTTLQNLGQRQAALGQTQQALESGIASQIGALGTGAQQYSQALLEAQRQGNVLGLEYPLSRLAAGTSVLSPLIGGYPGAPIPSPLSQLGTDPIQTALGSFAGTFKGLQPATQAVGQGLGGLFPGTFG